jgi:glyoxylase-like metal-dependent hydrolase (beta-lactamase superfamily II)
MTTSIDVYTAPPDKFFVNSFVVERYDALVLVDTQFLVSTATAVADWVASKRKRLAAIVITHPHPDHFNGLPVLLARFGSVPVYANRPTIETIRATQGSKRAAWKPVYGHDYPSTDALPDRVIGGDEMLDIDGIVMRSLDLGPGESTDITVLHVPDADALIVSDLVYNMCHPWLAEHRTGEWLEQLARVETSFPNVARIHPGHGPAGGRELLQQQRDYILEQRAAVRNSARNGRLDSAGLQAVRASAINGRAGWPLEGLIEMNAAALAVELTKTGP